MNHSNQFLVEVKARVYAMSLHSTLQHPQLMTIDTLINRLTNIFVFAVSPGVTAQALEMFMDMAIQIRQAHL